MKKLIIKNQGGWYISSVQVIKTISTCLTVNSREFSLEHRKGYDAVIVVPVGSVYFRSLEISVFTLNDVGIYVSLFPAYNETWVDILNTYLKYVLDYSDEYISKFEKSTLEEFNTKLDMIESQVVSSLCKKFNRRVQIIE